MVLFLLPLSISPGIFHNCLKITFSEIQLGIFFTKTYSLGFSHSSWSLQLETESFGFSLRTRYQSCQLFLPQMSLSFHCVHFPWPTPDCLFLHHTPKVLWKLPIFPWWSWIRQPSSLRVLIFERQKEGIHLFFLFFIHRVQFGWGQPCICSGQSNILHLYHTFS